MITHRHLILLISLAVPSLAQTPPPPYLLPSLPPGITQTVVITGSTVCPNGLPPCQSISGNWAVAVQGGSGGNHYDYSGNLLIGEKNGQGLVNMQSVPELGSILKMSPDGTVTSLISFSDLPTSCVQSSQTSLTYYYPYVTSFSVNQLANVLYVVTVYRVLLITWNSSTTTGSCTGGVNGPDNFSDAFTYATPALSGPSI